MSDITTEQAVRHLRRSLKDDEGFRYGYQANIAMAYIDEWNNAPAVSPDPPDLEYLHEIANRAAVRFLDLFIGDIESEKPEPPFTLERAVEVLNAKRHRGFHWVLEYNNQHDPEKELIAVGYRVSDLERWPDNSEYWRETGSFFWAMEAIAIARAYLSEEEE